MKKLIALLMLALSAFGETLDIRLIATSGAVPLETRLTSPTGRGPEWQNGRYYAQITNETVVTCSNSTGMTWTRKEYHGLFVDGDAVYHSESNNIFRCGDSWIWIDISAPVR